MIRPQSVVLPILREAFPDVSVISVIPDADRRRLPLVSIRRAGGPRHPGLPGRFSLPMRELAKVSEDGPVEATESYEEVLDALYCAVQQQITIEGVGYLRSLREAEGPLFNPSPAPTPGQSWAPCE